MLNWHRDPDYETRMLALRQDRQRIENEILQIERETEQLRRDNKRLKELNSRMRALLLSPDSSSSTPPEAGCD